jgi:hypothetical protein
MTERQWRTFRRFRTFLDNLWAVAKTDIRSPEVGADERKLRLVACGCCRRRWELLPEPARAAVVAAEQFCDGQITREELRAAEQVAYAAVPVSIWCVMGHPHQAGRWAAAEFPDNVIEDTPECVRAGVTNRADRAAEERAQCDLVRCVFGNPFRPVTLDPAWRTSATVGLALSVYESRDFGVLPVLADALQEAGCQDAAILGHCRGPGPHARGCWVVDWILDGK